jgi:hypothetical protein
VLVEGARSFAEAGIIIEYPQMIYPGPLRLIPEDPEAAVDVRFMDRFFDLYVMDGMQISVEAALGRAAMTPAAGLALATQRLERAYAWLDGYLGTRTWAAGRPTRFRSGLRSCAPTARGGWRGLPMPGRWMRRGGSGTSFRLGRRTGIDADPSSNCRAGPSVSRPAEN